MISWANWFSILYFWTTDFWITFNATNTLVDLSLVCLKCKNTEPKTHHWICLSPKISQSRIYPIYFNILGLEFQHVCSSFISYLIGNGIVLNSVLNLEMDNRYFIMFPALSKETLKHIDVLALCLFFQLSLTLNDYYLKVLLVLRQVYSFYSFHQH